MSVSANALCCNPLELFCIFEYSGAESAITESFVAEATVTEVGDYKISDETFNITQYVIIDGEKIVGITSTEFKDADSFGFVYEEKTIEKTLKLSGKAFDKKIYWELKGLEEFEQHPNNPYVLRKPLGFKKNVTNQIGQVTEEEVYRFLNFEDIFHKDQNVF